MKIKIGDVVRIKKYPDNSLLNKVGRVISIDDKIRLPYPYSVLIFGRKSHDLFYFEELEKISENEALAWCI